jgi:hypothetical protein
MIRLNTSWREVAGAAFGAIIGVALPILLHLQAAKIGDTEAWGIPIAAFSLPGFFIGAIIGASLARKRD